MKNVIGQYLSAGAAMLALMVSTAAWSAPDHGDRGDRRGDARSSRNAAPQAQLDSRYQHNHYYPPRGYSVPIAPRGVIVEGRGSRYWYSGGAWYRPYGPRYVVVRPPFGVFVPLLPPYYTTIWWSGVPYYYANDAYYVWRDRERGYEVVPPPAEREVSTAPPPTDDVFVYPRAGQSDEQISKDRYQCHRWAADQTGYDPTQPGGGVAPENAAGDRAEYMRAQTACLEGRGYSVR